MKEQYALIGMNQSSQGRPRRCIVWVLVQELSKGHWHRRFHFPQCECSSRFKIQLRGHKKYFINVLFHKCGDFRKGFRDIGKAQATGSVDETQNAVVALANIDVDTTISGHERFGQVASVIGQERETIGRRTGRVVQGGKQYVIDRDTA
jgi:hypothetical protein